MKNEAFSIKNSISVINFLTELKPACNSTRIDEGAATWHLWEFMNRLALCAVKTWQGQSSIDTKRREGTTTTFSKVVNHLLRVCATYDIIAKANEEIRT